jgi:chromosome segregation ATPase
MDAQLSVLKSKIQLLEEQLKLERERTRNLQEERDEAIQTAAEALEECEGVKWENKKLKVEIERLKQFGQNTKDVQSDRLTAKERVEKRVDAERKGRTRGEVRNDLPRKPEADIIQVMAISTKLTTA